MSSESATTAPVCYRHPDRSTLLSCSRCGKPICSECSVDAAVGQRCVECVRSEGTQKIIPARSRLTARALAPVTVGLITVTSIIFGLGFFGLNDWLFETLGQINIFIAEGQWWRIFTAALLHASVTHILFNMWALWVLGPQVERDFGALPFLALYIASAGVGGAVFYHLAGPFASAVGASGAIFGLFGLWLNQGLRRRNTVQGRAILSQMGFLLLINLAIPFLIPGVGWQAHLGGFVAGFLISEAWSRIRGPQTNLYRTLVGVGVAVLAAISVL
ncbi:MAG TPA: rhomboid family intramembrane serine protease [Acidimicrobiia bacterium]